MSTSELREKLINYLADASDRKVKALYTLLEEDINDATAFTLSKEQKEILDREREKYLNGEGESYSWEEAKKMILGKKAS